MQEFYDSNEEFREYVDRYSQSRKITVAEALTHRLVYEYAVWLKTRW